MRYAQLKAFHAVAKWGGFSRGAAKINLTQPAVSDHVRHLEETYGIQLFIRRQRAVTLTEVGRKLYVLSERLMETEGAAQDLLSRARGLKEGQLIIGADAAVHILPLLQKFRLQYPDISLAVTTGNSDNLLTRLESLEIDFAVVAHEQVSDQFESRLLSQDDFAAFSSKQHDFCQAGSVDLAKLVTCPLVLREHGSATRALFDQACRERGLEAKNIIEIEGREAAREAVAAGLGVGVVSKAEFVDDDRLNMIEIRDWDKKMSEWLVCLKSRTDLHIISALLDLV